MPWKDTKPMDEKLLFIADYLRQRDTMTGLCQHYGISRKTGYKWLGRYRESGLEGLSEQSRRPQRSPERVPYVLRQAIIALRQQGGMTLGPKKIQALLRQRFPDQPTPSKTTLYNILHGHGLVEPRRRRRRVASQPQPFSPAPAPNDVWSADYKGQFKTGDGCWCYPLTVMDHASRFLLACEGLAGTRRQESQAVFERLFREFGLPARIRTDNGVPFASVAPGGLSRLAIWWIRLGIVPERIEPGKPQQNGRHERMHRTLKQVVTHPVSDTMVHQQQQFDAFIRSYNEERPHEGLGQNCPASCYEHSPRAFPERLPEIAYPSHFEVHKVARNGVIYWQKLRGYAGYLLMHEAVGLDQIDDGIWDAYFGPCWLGRFDARQAGGKGGDYLRLKV